MSFDFGIFFLFLDFEVMWFVGINGEDGVEEDGSYVNDLVGFFLI